MRSHSYLHTARQLLEAYDGSQPFAAALKQFFKGQKKYGSRDRKEIAQLCYSYFRLGRALEALPLEEKILHGLFLASPGSITLQEQRPDWHEKMDLPTDEKLRWLGLEAAMQDVFPLQQEISPGIDGQVFIRSHLHQPDLHLRLRPGHEEAVLEKLAEAGLAPRLLSPQTVALENGSKVDAVVQLNREAVVQDRSSQKVLDLLPAELGERERLNAWDCCAASGGKSILLHDRFPRAELTVSDLRDSILHNLNRRFEEAGIFRFQAFRADVADPQFQYARRFDLVLCDAPCSGSGTWSRTPEHLRFFSEEKLLHYAGLQKQIVFNAAGQVKKGGYLLYITCSVYKKENEDVVEFVQKHTPLLLVDKTYYKGYEQKADTLFAALFQL